ncbi:hypothetical protein VOI54_04310 [Tamlana sp. 2201CG12-4]|uniref:hypothetical protein n=1 Tax=Tamlana sp. 2201CG12-4 TaxID=3112582 RepID=UPI002DB803A4|nr:hypothetical protein [Tamlana sp. 2201CG12-4]MEC3906227.1 hypothetical protein [Tamlana sp. 2201CG12-4]
MTTTKLKQIADNENGEYSIKEHKRVFTDGSRCPEIEHKIQFSYTECNIEILISTGFKEAANINCTLSSYIQSLDFEIESISPFINLFLRKKSRFKVKCRHKNFKYFLENKALIIFEETMKTKNFAPNIFSKNNGLHNRIVMEFHLAFSEWVEIFESVILFFKTIIDELKSDNRFISSTHYKENN